jgi:uncharacterized hydrophobic protein (TIGR00271 family)
MSDPSLEEGESIQEPVAATKEAANENLKSPEPEHQSRSEKETRLLNRSVSLVFRQLRHYIGGTIHLRDEVDEPTTVADIRKNIEFRGANFWTLICAIFIASIGLNINSTAVIIGAMLISPLMGPIMGAGLALGTNDIELLKRSLRNLSIAVFASVATSALYFSITPLVLAQSELLARTRPTIFDVLIAIFGGATGIIASSRKEKSNAIPGVAIATALMPPLCTAGFGLATWNMGYFIGAFYLFFINSVFICLATFVVVRYLKFKRVSFIDNEREKRVRIWIAAFALITILPSIYVAWEVVRETLFQREANQFIAERFQFPDSEVIRSSLKYNRQGSEIEITLIGEPLSNAVVKKLQSQLENLHGLKNTRLVLHQPRKGSIELEQQFTRLNQELRVGIVEDLYRKNETTLKEKDQILQKQAQQIHNLEQELQQYRAKSQSQDLLLAEIKVQYPELKQFAYVMLKRTELSSMKSVSVPTIFLDWKKKPEAAVLSKLQNWLKVRMQVKDIQVINR